MHPFSDLAEYTFDALIIWQAPGILLSWNHSAERLYGFTAAEAVGRSRADVLQPIDEAAARLAAAELARVGWWEGELRKATKDGRVVIVESRRVLRERDGVRYVMEVHRDVTDRRDLEEALREGEARAQASSHELATLMDTLPAAVWVAHDPGCQRITGSRLAHELLRMPLDSNLSLTAPDAERPVHFRVYRHGVELAPHELPVQIAAGGIEVRNFDEELVFDDGARVQLFGHAVPILDGDGVARGAVAAFLDVTASKRAEAELGEAHALLDAIFDAAPVGLGFWDREFRFIRVNERLAEINGLPVESHIGKTPVELLPGIDGLERLLERWQHVLASGETLVMEVTGETPAAPSVTRSWTEKFFPVRVEGQIVGIGAVVEETTDRRRTDEELRARARELRAVSDHSPDVLTRFDRSLRHVFVSAAVEKVTGRPVAEFLGRTNRELGMPERLCERWESALRSVFQNAVPAGIEFAFDSPGGLRHFAARLVPEFNDAGEVEFVLGVTQDITDRTELEAALRLADRHKDEFLATLAHELRNPLAPIRTGLEVMKRAAGDAATVARVREMMDRQLVHMIRLVDDLLDISRITSGKVVLQLERIDLRAVARTALETSRPFVDAARHDLACSFPDSPAWVDGDFTRLAQVVSNLLNNAAKFTPEGGRIALRIFREDGAAVIEVADSGVGIPSQLLPMVFEMFTQVSRTLARAQGGLGIGLALARRFVELHGGRIEASSKGVGFGSTFTIRLPAVAGSVPEVGSVSSPEAGATSPHRLRVLVVDDNRDAVETVSLLLHTSGHHVRIAHNAADGLAAAREFAPDIVFLDIGLPDMDGHDVARRLRAEPASAGTVVVALTGWGSDEGRRLAKEAGFDDHLIKPVDAREIDRLLAQTAQRRRPPTVGG
jgi:PAS domain S-box-containing protein